MAKKIFKGVKGLFGAVGSIIGGKKKAAPEPEGGPKITQLNPEEAKRRAPKRGLEARGGTILSSTLGGIRERLGG